MNINHSGKDRSGDRVDSPEFTLAEIQLLLLARYKRKLALLPASKRRQRLPAAAACGQCNPSQE